MTTFVGDYCWKSKCQCHINPAVSLGVFLNGGMSFKDFVGYVIAQFIGGIAGAGVLLGIEKSCGLDKAATGLGQNGFGDASYLHISMGGILPGKTVMSKHLMV